MVAHLYSLRTQTLLGEHEEQQPTAHTYSCCCPCALIIVPPHWVCPAFATDPSGRGKAVQDGPHTQRDALRHGPMHATGCSAGADGSGDEEARRHPRHASASAGTRQRSLNHRGTEGAEPAGRCGPEAGGHQSHQAWQQVDPSSPRRRRGVPGTLRYVHQGGDTTPGLAETQARRCNGESTMVPLLHVHHGTMV
jgi:hypothetical protein